MAVFSSSHLLSSQTCFSKVNRTGLQNFSGSSRNHHIRLTLRFNALPLGGPRISTGQKFLHKKRSISAPCLPSSEIASNAFTWGTLAVLPFYTFMIVAPKATITKKVVSSGLPYVILGTSYAYLLYLSWTPDTIPLMFSSKYWLPELGGIAKMFSGEITLASAWIHLLAVDLFAARQVYLDGLKSEVETRHSVSLCLLFCPVGILAHFITKSVSSTRGNTAE